MPRAITSVSNLLTIKTGFMLGYKDVNIISRRPYSAMKNRLS